MKKWLVTLSVITTIFVTPAFANEPIAKHANYDKAITLLGQNKTAEALELLKVSAEAEHVASQFVLGLTLSQSGKKKEGLKWFKKAAKNGDFRAQQILDTRAQYQ